MGMTYPAAVDYSYGRPGAGAIAGNGYVGAMRYLGSDGRCIGHAERDELLGAGLGIGLIWETSAQRPLAGWQAGADDAHSANGYADQLGAPNVPIFYAVDFQPTPDQLYTSIADYFRGAQSVHGRPVRAYGCASVMQCLCGDLGLMPHSWQCAAWSYPGSAPGKPISDGGYSLVLSPYASMLQNIGYVLGDTSDHNSLQTTSPDWFWGYGGDWFDMASESDLRRIVHEEVKGITDKLMSDWYTGNLVWADGQHEYEVTFDGNGHRVRRRISCPEERDLLKWGDTVAELRRVDVSKLSEPMQREFASWPMVDQKANLGG